MFLILTVLFPILCGVCLLLVKEEALSRRRLCICTGAGLLLSLLLVFVTVTQFRFYRPDAKQTLFHLTDTLVISFRLDDMGRIFAVLMAVVWVLSGFYAFEYMKHEEQNKRYFGFYLMTLGVLMGLCEAANLVTYYLFYELMTLSSFALVLHNRSKESLLAGLKYLFYSFAGAYMVLFGIYFVQKLSADPSMPFTAGGIIDLTYVSSLGGDYRTMVPIAMLLMLLGFSVKAGMLPMHGWLPTAHPVAPAPASAVLSGIIVKAGVLGILRTIFYVFGAELFAGSRVQRLLLFLSIGTIFMGSMLAYRERVFKKRLAYSTVSQVSYILFGLFLCNETAYTGALLHTAAHAVTKCGLFLVAGAIIYNTGCTRVEELRGIGKRMPVLMWCFTILSLSLIGIPPLGGFTSKWFLGEGALSAEASYLGALPFVGVAVLLVSALLTAGYLLPISVRAFLPGEEFYKAAASNEADAMLKSPESEAYAPAFAAAREPRMIMLVPVIILTALSVLVGLLPEVLML